MRPVEAIERLKRNRDLLNEIEGVDGSAIGADFDAILSYVEELEAALRDEKTENTALMKMARDSGLIDEMTGANDLPDED